MNGRMLTVRKQRAKLINDLPLEFRKLIEDVGAKIMPRDMQGKTPLEYAQSAAMIKLLKANGATEQ